MLIFPTKFIGDSKHIRLVQLILIDVKGHQMIQVVLPHGTVEVAFDSSHGAEGALTDRICGRHHQNQFSHLADLREKVYGSRRQTPQVLNDLTKIDSWWSVKWAARFLSCTSS